MSSSNAISSISTHTKSLENDNPVLLLLKLSFPIQIAELLVYIRDILSVYYQSYFFGLDAIFLQAYEEPLMTLYGEALPMAFIQYFIIIATKLESDSEFQELQVLFEDYRLVSYVFCFIMTVITLSLFVLLMGISEIADCFKTTFILYLVFSYLFVNSNDVYELKYVSENRKLLVVSQAAITCFIQMCLEAFIYMFYAGKEIKHPSSNWPSLCSYVTSQVVVIIWLAFLQDNYTALGVINKNPYVINHKRILKFTKGKFVAMCKYFWLSLPKFISTISTPVTIILCLLQINNHYTNQFEKYNAISDLFTYWHFGAICRISCFALNMSILQPILLCIKNNEYKRIIQFIWASIIICIIENTVIGAAFYLLKILTKFVADSDYEENYLANGHSNEAIFLSILSGCLDVIPEVAITMCNIEGFVVLPFFHSICKILMGSLVAWKLGHTNGEGSNFLLPLMYMEVANVLLGIIIIVMQNTKLMQRSKEVEKQEKLQKMKLKATK